MAPSLSPVRRFSLLGCMLVAALALLLPGCGDDSAATADNAGTRQAKAGSKSNAPSAATASGCPRQVETFVDSLDTLRRQLAIGLSYEQYSAKVKALRRSYDRLPIDRITIACLSTTGTPAEAALNKYVDAANAWGECLAEATCITATIEPVLQRKWRIASDLLSEAE